MEDDIAVGVQILLEDGLSEALAEVMKQLAATDLAIAATAANWQGLHLSEGAARSPPPNLPEISPTKPVQLPAGGGEAPILVSSPSDQQVLTAPTAIAAAPVLLSPLAAIASHADAHPAGYAPVPADASMAVDAISNAAPGPRAEGIDPGSIPTAAPSAPIDSSYGQPVQAPPAITIAPGPQPLSVAPTATDDRPTAAAAVEQMNDPTGRTQPSMGFAPKPLPSSESIAPKEIEPVTPIASATDLVPSGGTASDSAATAPLGEMGGGEGQLMLDGSLLGRWVIDHLSREADRPAAGGTAFDPRQSR